MSVLTILAILGSLVAVSYGQDFDLLKEKSYFLETFDDTWETRWTHSSHEKYTGVFETDTPDSWTEPGLKVLAPAKHYGIVAMLDHPIDPAQGLIFQYELKFTEGISCGGAYMKLLTYDPELKVDGLVDTTPYSIMFGPDKCGSDGKVHFILRHKSSLDGTVSEKHLMNAPIPVADSSTHVYTLRLLPENKYEVLIDGQSKSKGHLFTSMDPSINPPSELEDPDHVKPLDWVEEEKISNPEARQPEEWDGRRMIPDPKKKMPDGWLEDEPNTLPNLVTQKPEVWDDEEDGVWERPRIQNPKCRVGCGKWKHPHINNPKYSGEWKAPLIDNPAYKGPWVQKMVANPDHVMDDEPLASIGKIGAVAIEIWTVDSGFVFDNVLLTRDDGVALEMIQNVWQKKHKAEMDAFESEAQRKRIKQLSEDNPNKQGVIGRTLRSALRSTIFFMWLEPYVAPLLDKIDENPLIISFTLFAPPIFILIVVILFCTAPPKEKPDDDDDDDDKDDDDTKDVGEKASDEGEKKKAEKKESGAPSSSAAAAGAVAAPIRGKGVEVTDSEHAERLEMTNKILSETGGYPMAAWSHDD